MGDLNYDSHEIACSMVNSLAAVVKMTYFYLQLTVATDC